MKFYSIEMEGYLILEKVASLPVFNSVTDEGRILYSIADQGIFIGTSEKWTQAGGGMQWEKISNNTTAEIGVGYLVDSSVTAITITLPDNPDEGNSIGIKDATGNASTNNININGNGNNVEGGATFNVEIDFNGFILVFVDSIIGWVKTSETHGYAVYS